MLKTIKKFLDGVFGFVTETLDQKPVTPVKKRKYDTTPLTTEQIKYVRAYKRHIEQINTGCNPEDYITQEQIAEHLNIHFGFNKSTTTYRRYWSVTAEYEGG